MVIILSVKQFYYSITNQGKIRKPRKGAITIKALIDADIIAYQQGYSNERKVSLDFSVDDDTNDDIDYGFKEGDAFKVASLEASINTAKEAVENIIERVGASDVLLMFTGYLNYRKLLNSNYKANRKNNIKPIYLKEIKDYLKTSFPSVEVPGLEADDLLGLYQTKQTIICSIDKDLNQIPGKHFNWQKDIVYSITEEEAHYLFCEQTLKGDPTDNYGGIYRVGEKTAQKALNEGDFEDWWSIVENTYYTKGYTKEALLLNARMARILRGNEYNKEENYINLWIDGKDWEKFYI